MASSNIKLFDENKGNMLSDSEFVISNQRLNGLQTGVASSQLQNKAMYQASLIAYAIAQVMMQNGKNANDTDAVSAFVANLSGTMLQKVYDIATTAEAQAGVATGKWMSPALVKSAIDTLAAKAQNILSDETKALFGLGTDAVPDQVLKFLGQFNLYQWKRRKVTKKLVKTAVSQLVSPGSNTSFYVHYSKTAPYITNDFSDSSVKWESNPTRFGGFAASDTTAQMTSTLKNCYWAPSIGTDNTPASPQFYSGGSASFSSTTSNGSTTVTGTDTFKLSCKIMYSDWEILKSTDRNEYQDSGRSNPVAINDGYECYEYAYLGNPYELLNMLPQTSVVTEAANADVKLQLQ